MSSDIRDGILVIGSTGFIGRKLVDALQRQNQTIYALARSESETTYHNVHYIRGSIQDDRLLRDLISTCSRIVHLASLTTPSVSALAPELEVSENLAGLTRLLSLAADFPDRHVIYLSSAGAVYGDNAIDIDENGLLRPRSYYGAGKAAAEAFLHACTATTSWTSTVLRPSNIYGPGQTAEKGFAIIPTLLSCAEKNNTFSIWGDGRIVRDYCHVQDLVDFISLILGSRQASTFSTYNIASGQTASILELVAACERCTGRVIEIDIQPGRKVDVPHVSLDTTAASVAYGWKAKISLSDGLEDTWRWFQQSRKTNCNGAT